MQSIEHTCELRNTAMAKYTPLCTECSSFRLALSLVLSSFTEFSGTWQQSTWVRRCKSVVIFGVFPPTKNDKQKHLTQQVTIHSKPIFGDIGSTCLPKNYPRI